MAAARERPSDVSPEETRHAEHLTCGNPPLRARPADALMSGRADGCRKRGEGLEVQVEAGETENCGHRGRGGSQAQNAVQQPGAAADANQQGKPACIAEGHPGQIDDDPAGTRPQYAKKLLTQHGYAREVQVTADRRDGVTILTADGKRRGMKVMIDFVRRHDRPPISVPLRTRSPYAQGGAGGSVSARETLSVIHITLRSRHADAALP